MRKMKSLMLIVLTLTMILSVFTIGSSASSAYQTYTYSINGQALYSPDAYVASQVVNAADMGVEKLNNPTDMVADSEGRIYIANQGNNEILVLDRYYKKVYSITNFINDKGNADSFNKPEGVFIVEGDPENENNVNGELWVCDTVNERLVVFDRLTGEFKKIVDKPSSQLFDSERPYAPIAMTIDQYGRIYIVSRSHYEGIIVLDPAGVFVGYIGAQQVSISAWEIFWRKIQTDEQKKLSTQLISTTFNNMTITSKGFIYVTTDQISDSDVENAIKNHAKVGTYMPVKLLNPAGDDGEGLLDGKLRLFGNSASRILRGNTHDGEDRPLHRLHDGAIRLLGASLKGGNEPLGIRLLKTCKRLGDPAEEKREDRARVTSGGAKHLVCDLGGAIAERKAVFYVFECAHGKAHVDARITVGNGEHVHVVGLDLFVGQQMVCRDRHFLIELSR